MLEANAKAMYPFGLMMSGNPITKMTALIKNDMPIDQPRCQLSDIRMTTGTKKQQAITAHSSKFW